MFENVHWYKAEASFPNHKAGKANGCHCFELTRRSKATRREKRPVEERARATSSLLQHIDAFLGCLKAINTYHHSPGESS